MNKPNPTAVFKSVKMFISKRSPEILTGIGIAGMITTTVLAVRATPKALKLIEEKKKQEQTEKLTPIETVKVAWKPYIPSVVTCISSVACLIGSSSVSARRNAALYSAYKLSETALMEYKDKVIETIGEKKEQVIKDKILDEKLKNNPASNSNVIITNKGTSQCFDPLSGRYFESDIELIKKAINKLNEMLLHDMFGYVSLNDFYDELGLDHIDLGDDLGWNIQKGLIDIDLRAKIADNGKPCIVLDFSVAPRYDYIQ